MTRKLTFPKQTDLAVKARQYFKARAIGKASYSRADRLISEIAKELKPGAEILLNDAGRKAVLVDNFAEKDIVFRAHGIRRFELEVQE